LIAIYKKRVKGDLNSTEKKVLKKRNENW